MFLYSSLFLTKTEIEAVVGQAYVEMVKFRCLGWNAFLQN